MDIAQLSHFLEEKKIPKFRLKQIIEAVFQQGKISYDEISVLPKALRDELSTNVPILSFTVEENLQSESRSAVKVLLRLTDGLLVESVLMKQSGGRFTVCLSSQAGCPLRCTFCASGRNGLQRNLSAEEICDQVLYWKNYLSLSGNDARLSNVVFMGIGEPFLNWPAVSLALRRLSDPGLFGIGERHLSISTAGLPDGIMRLASDFPQVNLALSLHTADSDTREKLMPIADKVSLESLRKALSYYFKKSRRKVFLEYLLLDGVNDNQEDADQLVEFVTSLNEPTLLHVNLLTYNETGGSYRPSRRMDEFMKSLSKAGLSVTKRRSYGPDIAAACGQLAGGKVASTAEKC